MCYQIIKKIKIKHLYEEKKAFAGLKLSPRSKNKRLKTPAKTQCN